MCQPGIVLPVPRDAHPGRPLTQPGDALERAFHLGSGAHDADQVLHHHLELLLDLVGAFAGRAALERLERLPDRVVHIGRGDLGARRSWA